MGGTSLRLVVAVGLSAACAATPARDVPDSGMPIPQATDSGSPITPPPPSDPDAGVPPPSDPDAGAPGSVAPPTIDGGSLALDPAVVLPEPPAPDPDDPAACTSQVVPFPNVAPQAQRPCTVEDGNGTIAYRYRYDANGRVIYRFVHTGYGYDATYTSEDDGGVRVETLTENGRTSLDVTQLEDGKPIEADHFNMAADGALDLKGHSTWLYDTQGRQRYVISQTEGQARKVERSVYDPNGRPYYVDQTYYWPGHTMIVHHSFTLRSWFANGVQAHEVQACDIVGGAPCGKPETRWEPCGNVAYSGYQTGLGRGSSFTDWSWDLSGRPLTMHRRFNGTGEFFNATESFQLDSFGRAVSGTIVTISPPGYSSVPTEHHDYRYDDAGRLIEASRDGKIYLQARFDAAGRLVEVTSGGGTTRWTYDGCGP
jgi:hypothetical protein